jgi:hypothetical protein
MRLLRFLKEVLNFYAERFKLYGNEMDRKNRAGDFGKYPWQKDYGLWPWQRRRK